MRKLYLRLGSLLFVAAFCGTPSYASHYLGGEMSYMNLGNNTYRIIVRLYHDCHHGEPTANAQDLPLFYSIFTGSGTKYLSDSIGGQFQPMSVAPLTGCYHDANAYCAEYAYLQKIVTLPPSPDGYVIANQRCCMGVDVVNITNPEAEGLTLNCNVPGKNAGGPIINSGAIFNTLPPVRLCKNTAFAVDFSAIDPDGDSLAYRLVTAYGGGTSNNAKPLPAGINFSPLPYAAGCSPTNPLGAAGAIYLDPKTGIVTGSSSLAGDFLISVACDEYRNGVVISTVTRNYVTEVADCNKEVNAQIQADSAAAQAGLAGVSIVRCGASKTVSFVNQSTGATAYHWDFGVSGQADDTSSLANPEFTYPAVGQYPLTLIAYGTGCVDTLRTSVWISDDEVTPDFTIGGGPCLLDTLTLTDNSVVTGSGITQHIWHVADALYTGSPVAIFLSQPGTLTIDHTVITAGGCVAAVSKPYTVMQGVIDAGPDTTVVQSADLILRASGGSSYTWVAVSPAYFPNFVPGASYQQVATTQTGKNFIYIVTGKDALGCGAADTVHVTVSERGYGFVPTAFSPNGDGRNDVLKPHLAGYRFRSLSVFNSRGNRVFYSEDIHAGWDGRYSNAEAAPGVYFWMLIANDAAANQTVFKGDVTLIR